MRPWLPLLFESSIFVMDGRISWECLDDGGKSKCLGKPLASLVSSVERGKKVQLRVTGSEEDPIFTPINSVFTQNAVFMCN